MKEQKKREPLKQLNKRSKKLGEKYRAGNKALFEARDRAVAQAREKLKEAGAELKRVEASLAALPEVAALEDANQRAIRIAELKMTDKEFLRCRTARNEARAGVSRVSEEYSRRIPM